MKFFDKSLFLALGLAASSLTFAQAPGVRSIASSSTLDQAGSYMVTTPMFVGAGQNTGLTITGNSVTLDLNGQEIQCAGNLTGVGIRVQNAMNVVIRNGHISNCAMNVVVMNSANVRIEGLTIRGMGLAVNAPPPEVGVMVVQSRNVMVANNQLFNVGLGIFVRGSRSFGNRIVNNTLTAGTNAALGICYNPADGDANGPRGDLISGNLIRGFPTSISIVGTSGYNVLTGNTLIFSKEAIDLDGNALGNVDQNNTKVQLK